MKTKQAIYLVPILAGVIILGISESLDQKELWMSVGMVLLIFGVYRASRSWSDQDDTEEKIEK